LDVAMPMIYLSASNDHLFNPNLLNTLNIQTNARVSPNLASYLHINSGGGGVALTLSQIQRAHDFGADGVGFYDFPAYFSGYSDTDRQAIKDYFDSLESPPPPGPGNVLDDFEVDEGHFNWQYNFSPESQTFGLASGPANASGPSDRVVAEHQGAGVASQLLDLVATTPTTNWQLRHNSGIGAGQAAQPPGNVPLVADGYVGFWLKTDDAGVATVRIGIDDPVGNTAMERGIALAVIADNQWHLYQWNFDDDAHWDAFAGGANGVIDAVLGTVTIDSIWLTGVGNAQVYLDTVSHNPLGMLAAAPIPGDYNADGLVDEADYNTWRAAYGNNVTPGSGADGNGDGLVDTADYVMWRHHMSAAAGAAASLESAAVPEPRTMGICGILAGLLLTLRLIRRG
jgi:hypothetical protein